MFIGHYAVGFASKRFAPKAGLAPLLAAPLMLDLLWPVFLLSGLEHVRIVPGFTAFNPLDLYDFPWSHSLVMAAVWGALFGWLYVAVTKYRTGGIVIFWGVVSHWVLDFVSHTPDMPLAPGGGPKLGLGLWHSVPATIVVESLLFVIGVSLYARATRARNAAGRWGWWVLVAALAALYVMSIGSAPPPNPVAIATVGLALQAVTLVWAWWADRNRDSSPTTTAA